MTNQQAPEALRLADLLILSGALPGSVSECAGIELRHLHAENERLAALVEAQQPAPSAAAAGNVLPEFEELDDDLIDLACSTGALYRVDFKLAWEVMREGLRTPQPSPTPQADSQPAPVVDGYAATLKAQNDQFEHALAELVDLVCPGLDSGNLLVDAKNAGDAAQALRAARAPADSVTAPAGGVVAGPVVGYRVSDPHEPDLGHWLSEEPGAAWCVSEPLALVTPTPPAQAADSVLEDAARWNEVLMHVGAAYHLGGQHFTLNTLRIRDQMYLLRGSVAQHFTACIDDSRAARKQGGA